MSVSTFSKLKSLWTWHAVSAQRVKESLFEKPYGENNIESREPFF